MYYNADLSHSPGSGIIWLDDLRCTSFDVMLSTCQHRGFGVENCVHTEDVVISCTSSITPGNSFNVNLMLWSVHTVL